ncbi:helix-turn-helix domain-containing protein [Kitasatospora sp. NPDC006697]|uniref:helix-turn-helix domain-containing protein n=1 Tax=Kitasatospora sp. NPDC006697 TaxID=3364020 RepID=UPI003681F7D8
MPGRQNPTLRQRRLGAELRRMREQAGLSGSQLARLLGATSAYVAQAENGKASVSMERLHAIAATCMCANQPLIDALLDIIADREKGGWWEEYRGVLSTDFLEVAELERGAEHLVTYTSTFMPGLLQTDAYARSLFAQAHPPLAQQQVDLRVRFRMQRQEAARARGLPNSVYIHEAALRMRFCGSRILADQLDSLIVDSERPGTSIRVLPFDSDALPSPSENFTYMAGPISELDFAQMDTGHGGQVFDAPAHLARFRAIIARLGSSALPERESRELIRSIKGKVEDKHA